MAKSVVGEPIGKSAWAERDDGVLHELTVRGSGWFLRAEPQGDDHYEFVVCNERGVEVKRFDDVVEAVDLARNGGISGR